MSHRMWRRGSVVGISLFLACGGGPAPSDDDGISTSSGSSSGSAGGAGPSTSSVQGATSSSTATTGGSNHQAVCDEYSQAVYECIANPEDYTPDTWIPFCLMTYDHCPEAFECVASSSDCAAANACPDPGPCR